MKRIDVSIEGVTPLIMRRFTEEDQESATRGSRKAVATTNRGTPLEQCEKALYRDLDGTIALPQPNILRCFIDGGNFHKAGRKKITTQKESMLYSCLDIEGVMLPVIHKQPWKVDTRPIRNPSTGGRHLRHRPMFDDWRINMVVILDDDMIDLKLIREIIDDAGNRVGLGDYRPSTKGPYGRFVVTHWEVQD